MMAAKKGHLDIVDKLIDSGADLNISNLVSDVFNCPR